MCEKCEERERRERILAAQKKGLGERIKEINHIVENQESENKRIDEEMAKHHIEAINGYDKQLEDSLTDIAKFSTKMLIMFEDYRKKGDNVSLIKILQSIINYAVLTRSSASVIALSAEMLIGKITNQ